MKPQKVSKVDIAFGAHPLEKFLPKMEEIPEEFKGYHSPWSKTVAAWFFNGLTKEQAGSLTPKEGIDKGEALGHIQAILGSFEPKHEHKEAGCAYLMSLWFEKPLVL